MFFRLCQQDLFAYADILAQSEAGVEGAITTDMWFPKREQKEGARIAKWRFRPDMLRVRLIIVVAFVRLQNYVKMTDFHTKIAPEAATFYVLMTN